LIINLKSLPLDIYKKIPISIKTYKNEYELSELPFDIQKLLTNIIQKKELKYSEKVYDFTPVISEYGDFTIIKNLRALVIDYISSYFYTLLGEYPFNGSVGSNVKKMLQKKDTTIQRLYLSEELDRMVRTFSSNIDSRISVVSFTVNRSDQSGHTDYTFNVVLNINDTTTNISTNFIL